MSLLTLMTFRRLFCSLTIYQKNQITPIKGVAFILVFVIPKLFDFIITGSLVFGQLANILEKNAFLTKVIDHKYSKHWFYTVASTIETFQDFSIKLDIEPLTHLLKISIFSLNSDIIRLTKIMNNLVKDYKILSFKFIFQCLKLVKSFQKNFLWRIFE